MSAGRQPLRDVDNVLPSNSATGSADVMTVEQRDKYNELVKAGTDLFNKCLWEEAVLKYKEALSICENYESVKVEKLKKRIAKLEIMIKEENGSLTPDQDKPCSSNSIVSNKNHKSDIPNKVETSPRLALVKQPVIHSKTESEELTTKREINVKPIVKQQLRTDDTDESEDEMRVIGDGFSVHVDLYKRLYEYQRKGILWMWNLYRQKKGGILADDMGLGKTVQVIAFFSGLIDAGYMKCALVVAPVSLFGNWQKEFEEWAPGIEVELFHGGQKQKLTSLGRIQRHGGVLLTSYQTLVNSYEDLSLYKGRSFTWDYIVLDEGHKIKNPSAKCSKSVYSLQATHRLVLTGTPVQNNLKEMWVLFDWAHQGTLLGTAKTFELQYEKPIVRSLQKDATLSEKRLGAEMSESLARIIAPYQLRRTKAQVRLATANDPSAPQFPKLTRKNDLVCWVYISELQQRIYEDFIQSEEVKLLLNSTKSPLTALVVLKKICDHPRLLTTRQCIELDLEYMPSDVTDMDQCAVECIANVPVEQLMKESGKLGFLTSLVDQLKAEGHRTLIFSQSVRMLNIIDRVVKSKGHRTIRLDGSVKPEERAAVIEKFTNTKTINLFLLTTQVGGVGLTITAADRVVIYDPFWNPAVDSQAVDRAFRIGQTQNVVVYRLISCGTVEEKIYRRQVFKDTINKKTTGDTKNPCRHFSKQQLAEMFVLDDPHMSLTQMQIAEMYDGRRKTDAILDKHIAFLCSLNNHMFGLSDHDLMFEEEVNDESQNIDNESRTNIASQVHQAQLLLSTEGEETRRQTELMGKYLAPEIFHTVTKGKGTRPPGASTTFVYPPKGIPGGSASDDVDDATVQRIRDLTLSLKMPSSVSSLNDSVFLSENKLKMPAVSTVSNPLLDDPSNATAYGSDFASFKKPEKPFQLTNQEFKTDLPVKSSVGSPSYRETAASFSRSPEPTGFKFEPSSPFASTAIHPVSSTSTDDSPIGVVRTKRKVIVSDDEDDDTKFDQKFPDESTQAGNLRESFSPKSPAVDNKSRLSPKTMKVTDLLDSSPMAASIKKTPLVPVRVEAGKSSAATRSNIWLEETIPVDDNNDTASNSNEKTKPPFKLIADFVNHFSDNDIEETTIGAGSNIPKAPNDNIWLEKTIPIDDAAVDSPLVKAKPKHYVISSDDEDEEHVLVTDDEDEVLTNDVSQQKKRNVSSAFSPLIHNSTARLSSALVTANVSIVSPIYKKRRQSTVHPAIDIVPDSDDDQSLSSSPTETKSSHGITLVRDSLGEVDSTNQNDNSYTMDDVNMAEQTNAGVITNKETLTYKQNDQLVEGLQNVEVCDDSDDEIDGEADINNKIQENDAHLDRSIQASVNDSEEDEAESCHSDQTMPSGAALIQGHQENKPMGEASASGTQRNASSGSSESNSKDGNDSVDDGDDNEDEEEDDLTEEEQKQYVTLIEQSRAFKREGKLVASFRMACDALKIYDGDDRLRIYAQTLLKEIEKQKLSA